MKDQAMKHILFKCVQPCEKEHCNYCEGGLAYCAVCGGAEASLPTECPGRKLTAGEKDHIMAGTIDFVGGVWVLG